MKCSTHMLSNHTLRAILSCALLAACSGSGATDPGPGGDVITAGSDGQASGQSDVTQPADTNQDAVQKPETDTVTVPDAPQPDTAPTQDAAPVDDAAPQADTPAQDDTGSPTDTAASSDATATTDTHTVEDTGSVEDAGSVEDTGSAEDTWAAEDTGMMGDTEDPGTPCIFGGLPACPDGEYCMTEGCGLGMEGVCTDIPMDCQVVGGGTAVCACDGLTYANECFARKAGQRPIGPAPCPAAEWNCTVDTTGWGFGDGCGVNEYCFGGCAGEGFCKERPICGTQQMNVQCGCNGSDYGSPCLIASSGKNLDHPGWCGEPNYGTVEACGGEEDFVCSVETDFCDRQSCEPDADGLCVGIWVPGVSPGELCLPGSPEQCGCDDITYLNKCARVLAGIALKHEGACGMSSCDLAQSGQCGMGLYCMGLLGDCTGDGVCKSSPFMCGLIPGGDLPVCGCDGNTYDSLCDAQQADMSVVTYGECGN